MCNYLTGLNLPVTGRDMMRGTSPLFVRLLSGEIIKE